MYVCMYAYFQMNLYAPVFALGSSPVDFKKSVALSNAVESLKSIAKISLLVSVTSSSFGFSMPNTFSSLEKKRKSNNTAMITIISRLKRTNMYGTLGRVPTSILREPCLPRYRGGNRPCVSGDASPPTQAGIN